MLDRQPGPALETSFANGGQISTSHAEPWANPGAPWQALKWLGREDAPLLWRLRADPAQWAWGLRFLRECTPSRTRANIVAILRLALDSRDRHRALRVQLGLEYDQLERGILHFYTDPAVFEHAIPQAALMREFGCERVVKSADECLAIEPALRESTVPIVGGTYTAHDESGQLLPDIERPVMSIGTGWRAANPREVESEILEPQEEVLQGLPGLTRMDASAFQGFAQINLEFALETDMQATLIEVISRMNRIPPLPADANPPTITLGEGRGGGAGNTLSWFFVQQLPGNPKPIEEYQRFIEDVVIPRIESVPGVADAEAYYGAPEELRITFDPYRAAQLGVPISRLAAALSRQDDASGGQVEIGRRQYTLRFAGRFSPEELRGMILEWRDGRPITLGDVATVEVKRGDRTNCSIQNGNPAVGMQVTSPF